MKRPAIFILTGILTVGLCSCMAMPEETPAPAETAEPTPTLPFMPTPSRSDILSVMGIDEPEDTVSAAVELPTLDPVRNTPVRHQETVKHQEPVRHFSTVPDPSVVDAFVREQRKVAEETDVSDITPTPEPTPDPVDQADLDTVIAVRDWLFEDLWSRCVSPLYGYVEAGVSPDGEAVDPVAIMARYKKLLDQRKDYDARVDGLNDELSQYKQLYEKAVGAVQTMYDGFNSMAVLPGAQNAPDDMDTLIYVSKLRKEAARILSEFGAL